MREPVFNRTRSGRLPDPRQRGQPMPA